MKYVKLKTGLFAGMQCPLLQDNEKSIKICLPNSKITIVVPKKSANGISYYDEILDDEDDEVHGEVG